MSGLRRYIAQGEHQQQDFKMRIDDSKKIARTLAAFANTDGGRILIGVKDNGTVSGINAEEEFHMIEAAAEMYCQPPIPFSTQVWKEDFKSVLEIIIEPSNKAPHSAINEDEKWKVYLRREDKNIVANRVMVKVWDHHLEDRPTNFQYTANEESLFKSLKTDQKFGFKKAQRILDLNSRDTEDILAQLIAWEVLEMEISDSGVFYRLHKA